MLFGEAKNQDEVNFYFDNSTNFNTAVFPEKLFTISIEQELLTRRSYDESVRAGRLQRHYCKLNFAYFTE